MSSYLQLFNHGEAFESFVSRGLPAEIAAVRVIQQKLAAPEAITPATQQRIRAVEGRFHLLAASEMWCPDCQINVTVLDFLQRMHPNIGLAIMSKGRAENELKERLGLERISIPLVLVLDEQFQVTGRFIERPRDVLAGGDAVKPEYRAGHYLESTIRDLLDLFETAKP
ncbi:MULTISPECIES: thioredoxin family protein [unclassified Pseudomonas]|uniref:thioredoxin family protein n=1 Tax=unclassified Pseudomonas TaxID=196821 RepID=UPI0026003C51|nr:MULTISPECIES: thioredoxin family protein [unclassified Pseudomonas]